MVSGGRLELGVGAGWLRGEWDVAGLDFDSRGARLDEALEVCRRLWTEQQVAHHGRFFDFDAVMFEPKPLQRPHPRSWSAASHRPPCAERLAMTAGSA